MSEQPRPARPARPVLIARVARVEPAAREQWVLALEHDAAAEAAHTRPGQYCQLSVPGTDLEGYFVLIDPPGAGPMRFLLRGGSPAADALRALAPGTAVGLKGPLGEGFPVEQAHGRDVLLVSAGSGIAAIRPVLITLVPFTARRVWLYHGTRTQEHVPFEADLEHARRAGVVVKMAVSQATASEPSQSWVQHAIETDGLDLSNAVAFASGMPGMLDALKDVLPRLGLPAERLYLNF